MDIHQIAFELRKIIVDMQALNVRTPSRDVSVALTHAETALMWANRAVFSKIGHPGPAQAVFGKSDGPAPV